MADAAKQLQPNLRMFTEELVARERAAAAAAGEVAPAPAKAAALRLARAPTKPGRAAAKGGKSKKLLKQFDLFPAP